MEEEFEENVEEEEEDEEVSNEEEQWLEDAEEYYDEEVEEELAAMLVLLWKTMYITIGAVLLVIAATKYPQYLHTLHENQLWFSNIKEVEREISFRTEQGLYYSYYKQILQSKDYRQGFEGLTKDNITEHGRTINIWHRFHIFPEVILSAVYRYFGIKEVASIFYVKSVFWLHGVYFGIIFGLSWLYSKSFLAGLIAIIAFVIHRIDTTRVNYTVPLRESFAIPILSLQVLMTSLYLRGVYPKLTFLSMGIVSTLFLLCWQLSPFVIFCQILSSVILARLQLLATHKVQKIILVSGASLIISCLVQNLPPLAITSPALSAVIPAIILTSQPLLPRSKALVHRLAVVAMELLLFFGITIFLNWSIRTFLHVDADSHVYRLLIAKLQLNESLDFDTRLYICNEAFSYVDKETLVRLTISGLLPVYGAALLLYGAAIFYYMKPPVEGSTEKKLEGEDQVQTSAGDQSFCIDLGACRSPDFLFFLTQSALWCVLALLIMRLKVLWLPSVCIICGVVMTDQSMCQVLNKSTSRLCEIALPHWLSVFLKFLFIISIIGFTIYRFWGQVASEIWPEELYEFWDPDTVELMEWIVQHTPSASVFAGSMQLLAAVKLSSGRHITNHPHYEDPWLRHRTREIYQIYGRESPETVHKILRDVGVTHIILEDSICRAPIKATLCRLNDIVDLYNSHKPEASGDHIPNLRTPDYGRFCEQIRWNIPEYNRLFSLVMSNKTFRVYRVANTRALP